MRAELLAGSLQAATRTARVHTESERQAEAFRYPEPAGSNCPKGDADGHGADMGE